MIELPLSQGRVALIDDEDSHLAAFKWTLARRRSVEYAFRNLPRPRPAGEPYTEYLHHAVIGKPPQGQVTDHEDGDGLNCRRYNIRHVTKGVNALNTPGTTAKSGHRGVRQLRSGRWGAYLALNNKQRNLGTFDTLSLALHARITAERDAFGIQDRRTF